MSMCLRSWALALLLQPTLILGQPYIGLKAQLPTRVQTPLEQQHGMVESPLEQQQRLQVEKLMLILGPPRIGLRTQLPAGGQTPLDQQCMVESPLEQCLQVEKLVVKAPMLQAPHGKLLIRAQQVEAHHRHRMLFHGALGSNAHAVLCGRLQERLQHVRLHM